MIPSEVLKTSTQLSTTLHVIILTSLKVLSPGAENKIDELEQITAATHKDMKSVNHKL